MDGYQASKNAYVDVKQKQWLLFLTSNAYIYDKNSGDAMKH